MSIVISIDNISDDELHLAVKNTAAADPNRRFVILTEEEYSGSTKAVPTPFTAPEPDPVVEVSPAPDAPDPWSHLDLPIQ